MIRTRLLTLLSHAKKYIGQNVLWQWLALLAQTAAVFSITRMLEQIIFGTADARNIQNTVIVLILSVLIRFICDRMAAKASYAASMDVKRILREQIYEKLLRLGASYREKTSTSEVVQMSAEGVEQLEVYFGKYLPQLFYSLLAPVTLFAVLAPVNLKASIVLLVCVPLIPVSIVAVQKFAKKLLNQYWGIYTGLGDSFLENLQGLTTLKIYQADGMKAEEMDAEAQKFRRITMKVLTMQLNSTSVMDIVAYGGAAVGMIVVSGEFLNGNVSFSGALTIILLASEFFIPLRLLGSFFHIAMNGMAASDRIFRLLDLEEPKAGTGKLPDGPLDLELSEVHFSYTSMYGADDGRPHDQNDAGSRANTCAQEKKNGPGKEKTREILKGISLTIPAGSFVSLVGESGCGKSTIAGLLTGKNRGFRGTVKIGGIDLAEVAEADLMKHVTLVRHNSHLFKGTVEENLRMAKPDATEAEMEKVLSRVNLLAFLKTQQGLQTQLLEKAGNFSGGQCQRLALARALLHDTPVYLFDEATSNIDAESEELIMDVIRELARTRTVLLISHRLSNVVPSDCIYLLSDGMICERGTHDSLMKKRGKYYSLYEHQRNLEMFGQNMEAEHGPVRRSTVSDNKEGRKDAAKSSSTGTERDGIHTKEYDHVMNPGKAVKA